MVVAVEWREKESSRIGLKWWIDLRVRCVSKNQTEYRMNGLTCHVNIDVLTKVFTGSSCVCVKNK